MTSPDAIYTGRFAPSPSGELHFGSLVAALASWLDARHHHGVWLLRMEDLDPAREPAGAADSILHTLEDFGLTWDGEVLYQSTRLDAYQETLEQLSATGLLFACSCSRKRLRELDSIYDGRCRERSLPATNNALRIRIGTETIKFEDLVRGSQCQQLEQTCGDFILRRRDGLFAYQLAVVADDAYQQITHIIRGGDLLDSTPRQIYLQSLLSAPTPVYGHIPVALNEFDQKLSKQHFAAPLDRQHPAPQLHAALRFLGQNPAAETALMPVSQQLALAVDNWDIQAVPKLANIRV